jgi:hypothetical protein
MVLLLSIAAQTRVHDSQCKAEIASLEDRWLKAIEDADVTTLNQILGDDFVRPAPSTGQFITKSQLLAYYRSRKQMPSTGSKRIENLSVTLYGNTAITRGTVVSRDSSGRIVSKNLFTDVFVHREDRWQAVSAQENAQQGTDD